MIRDDDEDDEHDDDEDNDDKAGVDLHIFLGAKKRLYKRLRRSVVPSVRPHDAIMWKTIYVTIASRRGGGRGKLVTSLFLRA